ncbi:MAG: SRPBCC family protein [Sediminicola sp.]|tara:strand:- start:22845 stop:23267 length:423 start_codon:yes stop_codon:yes gene_type:complete
MKTLTNEITVKTEVDSPIEKVWDYWNAPEHIVKWNSPSPDWHSPKAQQDVRPGGRFLVRMEAKDGSFGFDFEGVYDEVVPHQKITYTLGDGRKVKILFASKGTTTIITETFDAEGENSLEMQQQGWQAILDNFKNYTETH